MNDVSGPSFEFMQLLFATLYWQQLQNQGKVAKDQHYPDDWTAVRPDAQFWPFAEEITAALAAVAGQ